MPPGLAFREPARWERKGWTSNVDAKGCRPGRTAFRAIESLALRKFACELQVLGQIFLGERTLNVALTQQFLEVPAGHLRQCCCFRHRQNTPLVKGQRQLLPQRRFNFIGRKAQCRDHVIGYCQRHLRHTQQYSMGPRFLKRGKFLTDMAERPPSKEHVQP